MSTIARSLPAYAPTPTKSFHSTHIGDFVARWTDRGLQTLKWSFSSETTEIVGKNTALHALNSPANALDTALQDYMECNFQSLQSVPIDGSDWPPFFAEVYRLCRAIPPGETVSYGQLAAKAGRPGAARAVGQAMRTNRIPLLIPCHRVVGSSGNLHGYSGPGGLATKQLLLDHERGIRRT